MKGQKGFTLIELSIAILIFVLFASIVANLNYEIFSNSVEAKRTSLATEIAIEILEYIGTLDIEDGFDENGNISGSDSIVIEKIQEQFNENIGLTNNTIHFTLNNDVYNCYVTFEDFANLPENNGKDLQSNILKIVTVKVSYNIGNTEQNITIKRVLTKK